MQYALITGASRGLGKAIVEDLVQDNSELIIFAVARNKDDLNLLAKNYPNRIIPVVADISSTPGLEKVKQAVTHKLGENSKISYLIHNAATIDPIGDLNQLTKLPLADLGPQIQFAFQVNVISPYLLTLSLSSLFAEGARILFISSRAADDSVPFLTTYACTKASIDHLAKNLQTAFEKKVAVGLVIPGELDTDMQGSLRDSSSTNISVFQTAKEAGQLIPPAISAKFINYLLCETPADVFAQTKWDIYYNRPPKLPSAIADSIPQPPPYLPPLKN